MNKNKSILYTESIEINTLYYFYFFADVCTENLLLFKFVHTYVNFFYVYILSYVNMCKNSCFCLFFITEVLKFSMAKSISFTLFAFTTTATSVTWTDRQSVLKATCWL